MTFNNHGYHKMFSRERIQNVFFMLFRRSKVQSSPSPDSSTSFPEASLSEGQKKENENMTADFKALDIGYEVRMKKCKLMILLCFTSTMLFMAVNIFLTFQLFLFLFYLVI